MKPGVHLSRLSFVLAATTLVATPTVATASPTTGAEGAPSLMQPSIADPTDHGFGSSSAAPMAQQPGIDATFRWYGWQTLSFDAAALAMVAVGVSGAAAGAGLCSQSDPDGCDSGGGGEGLAALGLVTYLVATPVVHAAHGNGGRAGLSLLARVAVPAAGVAISSGGAFPDGELIIGSVLAVMVVDSLVARERIERSSPAVTPVVSVGHGGAVFGLAGAL